MAAPSNSNGIYYDTLADFSLGMNSGIAPSLLPKNQLSFAINCTVRGGNATTRPPFNKQTLNYQGDTALQILVNTGYFQGAGVYRPDFGVSQIIAQISGHIISFTPSGNTWLVADISIAGDLNTLSGGQAWLWQAEKWLIISDGSGKLPIFYDGVSCRRSYGPSVELVAAGNLTNPSVASPPAIGSTVTFDISPDYTGPFNVPVIFNNAFYQPVVGSASTPSYTVTLKNISATAGGTIAAGSEVVVRSDAAGTTTAAVTFTPVVHASYPTGWGVAFIIQGATAIAPGTQLIIDGRLCQVIGSSATGTGGFSYTCYVISPLPSAQYTTSGPVSVTYASPSTPNVVLGTIVNAVTIPAQNATVDAVLSQLYSGPANSSVWIGNAQYEISAAASTPVAGKFTMVNLSDTSGGAYPDPSTSPVLSVPELPACRMGAYGMGRNWISGVDGITYYAGDIVGGASGTQANDYRDSVLKMTENDFLAAGGAFRLPVAGSIITSMTFTANLDTSLGQGPLQIGYDGGMFSNNSPVDRTVWAAITNPLQTQSLIAKGPTGQDSTILANSDILFRSVDGLGSLVIARRDFQEWGNTPISFEVIRVLRLDNRTLLQFGSAADFDNRFLTTSNPQTSANGTYHPGLVALNFDLISTLRGKAPPVYDGLWLGLNVLKLISGNFSGTGRSFAFGLNLTSNSIELYELLTTVGGQHFDNGTERIVWRFETPVLFKEDIKPLSELVRLLNAELSLQEIDGKVDVTVEYRPDYYPCWVTWKTLSVCSDMVPTNARTGYNTRLSLGEPSADACEEGSNRPFRIGHFFQFRITFTGHCKFMGMRVQATTDPVVDFAPPVCTPICSDTLDIP